MQILFLHKFYIKSPGRAANAAQSPDVSVNIYFPFFMSLYRQIM